MAKIVRMGPAPTEHNAVFQPEWFEPILGYITHTQYDPKNNWVRVQFNPPPGFVINKVLALAYLHDAEIEESTFMENGKQFKMTTALRATCKDPDLVKLIIERKKIIPMPGLRIV